MPGLERSPAPVHRVGVRGVRNGGDFAVRYAVVVFERNTRARDQQRRDQQVIEMAVGELEVEALAARASDQDFRTGHAVGADFVAHHRLVVVGQDNPRGPHDLEDGIGRRGVARGFFYQRKACQITVGHERPLKLFIVFKHAGQLDTLPMPVSKTTLTLQTQYWFTEAYAIEYCNRNSTSASSVYCKPKPVPLAIAV